MFWNRKPKQDKLDEWPEMVMVKKEFFEDCLRHMMVMRFIQDLNQDKNGGIRLPADYLWSAKDVIDEAMEQTMAKLQENAVPINRKMQIWGIKVVDGKAEGDITV